MEFSSLVFKALSDPTRRSMLERLRAGDLNAGELAEGLPMTKASVSHHLSLLKQAGLVRVQRQGQNQIYTLDTTVFQEAMQWLMDFFQKDAKPASRRPKG
ncbi:MAG: winged helix-turn-helix transcriptional regulator [Holophaga sp.]|nr:winged helix-turn-helix transcriptional regulator [Holophaga sp.]